MAGIGVPEILVLGFILSPIIVLLIFESIGKNRQKDDPNYATFGRRFAAVFIDSVLYGLVGTPAATIASEFAPIFILIVMFGNEVVLLGLKGQSAGKTLTKIIVLNEQGKPIGILMAIVRYLSKVLSALPVTAGYCWMLLDRHAQTWHDKLARSRVYNVSPITNL